MDSTAPIAGGDVAQQAAALSQAVAAQIQQQGAIKAPVTDASAAAVSQAAATFGKSAADAIWQTVKILRRIERKDGGLNVGFG